MLNVVVVPIYKPVLEASERVSLRQCFDVFKDKELIVIIPKKLNIDHLLKEFPFNKIITFDNYYFESINGYNRLMLSSEFYGTFINYSYLLIYQLDAFVFSDQLDLWCEAGFDYIGAPWLRPLKHNDFLNKLIFRFKRYMYIKFNLKKNGLPKGKQFYNKVGNGGFSLRNVSKFYALAIQEKKLADYYINLNNPAFNEDLFWSIEINRKKKRLNIPNYKTAVKFSIETHPEYAIELNHGRLPFGCHAWEKNLGFWRSKIYAEDYTISI